MKEQQEQADEITITYGSLLELLLREKERGEIQKLDGSFFRNVVRYLKDKNAIIVAPNEDVFSKEEKEKTTMQLVNIKRILKELYDRREKKLMLLALEKTREPETLIDESVMLEQEKEMFNAACALYTDYRHGVLKNILNLKSPELAAKSQPSNGKARTEPESKPKVTKLVRFLLAVPKFVGKELEEYGPFDEEDIASLPVEIADVLIKKQRAEEIKEE
jgi:DNA replication initiation complex subunit (GINS family)